MFREVFVKNNCVSFCKVLRVLPQTQHVVNEAVYQLLAAANAQTRICTPCCLASTGTAYLANAGKSRGADLASWLTKIRLFPFYFLFMYLRERASMSRGEGQREKQTPLLSREPDGGPDPRTLGS